MPAARRRAIDRAPGFAHLVHGSCFPSPRCELPRAAGRGRSAHAACRGTAGVVPACRLGSSGGPRPWCRPRYEAIAFTEGAIGIKASPVSGLTDDVESFGEHESVRKAGGFEMMSDANREIRMAGGPPCPAPPRARAA